MKNQEIAKIFYEIADILELQEVPWKPQAYRKAAQAIESLPKKIEEIAERDELEEIPGVGESIAEKIQEYLKTGKIKAYEQLRKQIKVNVGELSQIPELGPRKIKTLYQKLGVKNISDLKRVIKQGKLAKLAGFGEKTKQTLLEGIKFVQGKPQRMLYVQAQQIAQEIVPLLKVERIEVAGSFRRGKETVGDLDLLVISGRPEEISANFTSMPMVKKVLAEGKTRSSVRLTNGLQVDLRVVSEKEFGSALLYFTGNKEHNIELRKLALKKGYTLSEYGLFKVKGKKWVAGRTEEEIYRQLGMAYIPPELRRNDGEITAALEHKLPNLVQVKDINGLFHQHTLWSDGKHSLLEMAQEVERLKFKFISFNDHFGKIKIAHPLDEKRLVKYLTEIENVRKKVDLEIFSGIEIDILKDGRLPLSWSRLKELDFVVGSVHSSLNLPEPEMTSRICFALENGFFHALGHPSSRLINTRPSIKANWEKIFQTAKENSVFLEINASPKRMDLSGEQVKSALRYGNQFILSTDAHDLEQLQYYPLGVLSARRGWLKKKDLVNCWSLGQIRKSLR